MKRRKLMREHIQNTHVSSKNNKIMENDGDDIDFLVEFPDKDGNSFHAPSMKSFTLIKGRCERCHKEYLANKNKPDYIFIYLFRSF